MEEIQLTKGDGMVLTLPGLGTAGYQWFVTIDDPKIAQVIRLERPPGTLRGVSGSVEEWFSVTPRAEGQTVLHFAQRRTFEPNRPPLATREYRVVVQ